MAKAFSVASWNVEHFRGNPNRVSRVVSFLKAQDPDIFGLYEVTGAEVFSQMQAQFPGYHLQITEGPQSQEILVGVRNTLDSFITQKTEFRSGTTHMRPGQVVTITLDEKVYTLVFLHLASGTKPRGFGLRDDMLYKAVKFRSILDGATGGKNTSNYVFLGDLNTMGLKYPYKKDIKDDVEMKRWNDRASRYYGMVNLEKTSDVTWWGGTGSSYDPAELDHVFAANNIKFKKFHGKDVDVRGWVNETTDAKKTKWIQDYSDHSLLYFEMQKV
jgi:hypothetical protein